MSLPATMYVKGKLDNNILFSRKNEFMWGKILVRLSPGRTEHRIKESNIHRGCEGEMVTEIRRMDSFSVMVLLTAILEQRHSQMA